MKNLINTTNINTVDFLNHQQGKFRYIIKCRAGYLTVVDLKELDNRRLLESPEKLLTKVHQSSLQAIEFCPEGSANYLTVFARVGKRVVKIDQSILAQLTVGTINQHWSNTNLYSQAQYLAVGATNLDDYAYTQNNPTLEHGITSPQF